MSTNEKISQKSAWFYIAWIIGIVLLFSFLIVVATFIYVAYTGDTSILSDNYGFVIPLILQHG